MMDENQEEIVEDPVLKLSREEIIAKFHVSYEMKRIV
jgi:hypothetical protein